MWLVVAGYFLVLGARVIAYDTYIDPQRAAELGVELTDLNTLVSTADVVSLHLPVTDETTGIFTAEHFSRLKERAVFINSARAALYDEADLVRALEADRFSAYLDVFASEPLSPDHPFHALPNVYTSSHIGGTNDVMYERMGYDSILTLKHYFETGELKDARGDHRQTVAA